MNKEQIRVIVAGPRDYWQFDVIKKAMDYYLGNLDWGLVCGMAPGVDTVARNIAEAQGRKIFPFPADWDQYGKSAGPIRNGEMANFAEALLAFDNGSPGTANMIKQAKQKGLRIKIVKI